MTRSPPMSIEDLREIVRLDPESGLLYSTKTGKPVLTYAHWKGYRYGIINGRNYRAHRVAYALHHGRWPENEIDHINHIRHDNRPANLRDVTSQGNARNRCLSKRNKTGRIGVLQHQQSWRAYITSDYKNIFLGTFETFAEAVAARRAAEIVLGFHANHGAQRLAA